MYRVELREAYFPAQPDGEVLETTVGGLLRDVAAGSPDAPALVEVTMSGETGREWTYGELLGDAERLAAALASRFAPGERVAVWAPNIPEWVLMEYACALAGLILVTVNPAYQRQELDYVLRQSRASGLFLVPEYRGNPMQQIAGAVCADIPAIREVTNLEDHDALFAAGGRDRVLPEVKPGDPAQIQYTSGTTGFPKGAVLHHRGVVTNALLVKNRMGIANGSTYLNFMPLFHTAGCGILTLGCLHARGRMLVAKLFDPPRMNALIERERVTTLMGVPTMLIGLLEAFRQQPVDVSSIQMAVSGGSMVPPDLVRRICDTYECGFQIVYGQTETSPVVTQSHADDSVEDIAGTVGQPLPQTEISIRDPQTNEVVPVDTIGEICVRGYCAMLEYNDNPEATAGTIDAQGWLHTGDLGTMDARGYVRVTGRVKDMIIRGGENIFPAEIENVLADHPAVAEAAVVGVPDDKWGEIAVCFYRREPGADVSVQELIDHCRAYLAPQKTPARWIEVTDWPLTGSGKIQKFVLRERYQAGEFGEE
ncbi:MAG: AMP-binding protein [Alphaproteobacteria bacterium]